MPRFTLLFAVCFGCLFVAHLQAADTYVFVELKGHTDTVSLALFFPDSKKVLTASLDKTARIWDAETGKELKMLEGDTDGIRTAVFSPDGKRLVTHARDNLGLPHTSRMWDTESGKEPYKIDTKIDANFWSFLPDGKFYSRNLQKGVSQIWDTESGKELLTVEGIFPRFSANGKKLAMNMGLGNDTARVWDVESGKELPRLQGTFRDFSPDGKKVVVYNNALLLLDTESGKELLRLQKKGDVDGYGGFEAFSPDGKKYATQSGKGVGAPQDNPTIYLWDAESGKELQTIEARFVRFSPDGKKIVALEPHGDSVFAAFQIWDAESGVKLLTIDRSTRFHGFTPDGKKVVTSGEKVIRFLDAESGAELHILEGRLYLYGDIFSPDGKRVVTLQDNVVRIWDLERLPPLPVRPAIVDF